jgi:hypothetical protein
MYRGKIKGINTENYPKITTVCTVTINSINGVPFHTFVRKPELYQTVQKLHCESRVQNIERFGKTLCPNRPFTDRSNNSAIYKLKCHHCSGTYIAQAGRAFTVRYKEYIHSVRNSNEKLGYSQHIMNTGH